MDDGRPPIVREVGFDFHWDETKVWKLDLPVTKMDVAELAWHFEVPFLCEHRAYDLLPRDVIDHPALHASEHERVMRADLAHPLDVMENKGRWVLLDGLHRLMKASILGRTTVRVRVVPRERIADIETRGA